MCSLRNPLRAAGEENFWTPITGEHEQACKHPPNGAAGATRNTCLFVQEGTSGSSFSTTIVLLLLALGFLYVRGDESTWPCGRAG